MCVTIPYFKYENEYKIIVSYLHLVIIYISTYLFIESLINLRQVNPGELNCLIPQKNNGLPQTG